MNEPLHDKRFREQAPFSIVRQDDEVLSSQDRELVVERILTLSRALDTIQGNSSQDNEPYVQQLRAELRSLGLTLWLHCKPEE